MYPFHSSLPARLLGQPPSALVLRAAELISQADSLVIAAGAGLGVDSGLPDFRGETGFWQAYPALGQRRMAFAEIASPQSFRDTPQLAWGFYGHRLDLYRRTKPHAGFTILQRWSERATLGSFIYTSNVDGQFQAAGFSEMRLHECHGSLHWLQCLQPCCGAVWSAAALCPQIDVQNCLWRGELPLCPYCSGLARPNVLMFGDGAWLDARYDQQFTRMAHWLESTRRLVVIEIGAGTSVTTVRHLSDRLVRQFNARLVRINPREPGVDMALDVGIGAGALQTLQAIEQMISGNAVI